MRIRKNSVLDRDILYISTTEWNHNYLTKRPVTVLAEVVTVKLGCFRD